MGATLLSSVETRWTTCGMAPWVDGTTICLNIFKKIIKNLLLNGSWSHLFLRLYRHLKYILVLFGFDLSLSLLRHLNLLNVLLRSQLLCNWRLAVLLFSGYYFFLLDSQLRGNICLHLANTLFRTISLWFWIWESVRLHISIRDCFRDLDCHIGLSIGILGSLESLGGWTFDLLLIQLMS